MVRARACRLVSGTPHWTGQSQSTCLSTPFQKFTHGLRTIHAKRWLSPVAVLRGLSEYAVIHEQPPQVTGRTTFTVNF